VLDSSENDLPKNNYYLFGNICLNRFLVDFFDIGKLLHRDLRSFHGDSRRIKLKKKEISILGYLFFVMIIMNTYLLIV
jgi:hypothetical protein